MIKGIRIHFMRFLLVVGLCGVFVLGCKDKSQSNPQEGQLDSSGQKPAIIEKLEALNTDDKTQRDFVIYQIAFEKENVFLYIQQNHKGILSAAFRRNHQSFKCALKNTLKSLEIGVLNGEIDCQKQFIAQIQDGQITNAKITKSNVTDILQDENQASNIASVSDTFRVELLQKDSFSITKQRFIQTTKGLNQGIRIDALCSNNSKIQDILNQYQAKNFRFYKINTPSGCGDSQAQFERFLQGYLSTLKQTANMSSDDFEIEYVDYNIDFFNEHFLQLKGVKFVDMGGAHGMWSSEYALFDYKGREFRLDKIFFGANTSKITEILKVKHNDFLQKHLECATDTSKDFNYAKASIAFGYDGVYFIYPPYELAHYACGEVQLKLDFYEAKAFIQKDSNLFGFINNIGVIESSKPKNEINTLYLECSKCEISTLYTQDQILELRNKLGDDEFYKKMSYKELDKDYLKQYDIDIKPAIYDGDYDFIDFNHKYVLDLRKIENAHYILYQEGKKPYCIQDKDSNAEIDKYFGIQDFIEVKVLNKVKKIEITDYLKNLQIDMGNNICSLSAQEIKPN